MAEPPWDVVICGASFAGLMTARALRGHRVLVVDRHPVGDHQTSACGAPLAVLEELGLGAAVEQVHDTFVLHTGRRTIEYRLPYPFCTFDYRTLCRELAAQTDAEVRQATVRGREGNAVVTTDGDALPARQLVDAAGFRRVLGRGGPRPIRPWDGLSYGIETPAPSTERGLHFYVGRDVVADGFGWAFPAGAATRAGLGAYGPKRPLKEPLDRFLARERFARRSLHGNHIPHQLRAPVDDGVVFVGDAAGQVLPTTAEGIRPALYFAAAAGRLIAEALEGQHSLADARARYAAFVAEHVRHFRRLGRAQRVLAAVPDPMLRPLALALARPRVFDRLMGRYWRMAPPDVLASA